MKLYYYKKLKYYKP